MTEFKDRIALVTGASRGLGYAVAEGLARGGAQVIALARTVGGLEELDEAAGGGITLVPLDLTDDPGLERLGAAIHERWGRLDLWVHTAVHAPPLSPVEHVADKDLDRTLAVNLRAFQRLIRVVDPLLRRAEAGRAVWFADASAEQPFHGTYLAAKAGQQAIAAMWAAEIRATSNIRVIAATPPPMPTALRARFYPGEDRSHLTAPSIVAGRLLAQLAQGADGPIDLRA